MTELVRFLAIHAKLEMFEGTGDELEHLRLKRDVIAIFKSWKRDICLGAEVRNNRETDYGLERGG